jgi:hypothetical protein
VQETKSSASQPFTLWPKSKGRRILKWLLFKRATDSRRKFGLDGNGNPNYGQEVVGFFSINNWSFTRSWPWDWRGYFEQGLKWHAPLSLDFGLGLWRLHTMPKWRLCLLYFIGYFQLISSDSQQSLATQSHGLSTWTAIVWTGPNSHTLAGSAVLGIDHRLYPGTGYWQEDRSNNMKLSPRKASGTKRWAADEPGDSDPETPWREARTWVWVGP